MPGAARSRIEHLSLKQLETLGAALLEFRAIAIPGDWLGRWAGEPGAHATGGAHDDGGVAQDDGTLGAGSNHIQTAIALVLATPGELLVRSFRVLRHDFWDLG